MKQIFTLAAAAVVALGATAAPRMEKVDVPVSALGAHHVMTTAAQMQADLKAGIERPGTVKRSYLDGNIEWTFVMVPSQPLFEYFYPGGQVLDKDGNPTGETRDITDIPYWGVECLLTGYNITNDQEYAFFPLLLSYPCQYWKQMAEYRGPLEEGPEGGLYIPDGAIDWDYTIMPFTTLMDDPTFRPRWMDMDGYFQWTLGDDQGYYVGDNYFGVWGFGGGHYGYNTAGNQYVLISTEFDMETNRNGQGTYIDFASYSPDDNSTVFEAKYIFDYARPNASTGRYELTGASGECTVNFEGVGYFNGFETRTLDFQLANLHIFNAGMLDYEEMGDTYPFFEYPEEPLQMYYVCGGGEGLVYGFTQENMNAMQKDPTFNVANITLGADDGYDPDNFVTLAGMLFNKQGDSYENQDYFFNPAYEEEVPNGFGGGTTLETDCIDPKPNTFVTRTIASDGKVAPWFRPYALVGTYFSGYYNYPLDPENAFVATQTPNGFVVRWNDQFNNKVSYTFDGLITWHPEYEDMSAGMEVESVGDHAEPTGIKAISAIFDSVKVSAKNGVISVLSAENADVQVINLNGQLVNTAKAVAGETVNVKADKGLYLVKVGKQVRKVVL